MKIPEQELNYLIDDEKKANENYLKLGLPNLAKDELKHYHYLLNLRKQWYGY